MFLLLMERNDMTNHTVLSHRIPRSIVHETTYPIIHNVDNERWASNNNLTINRMDVLVR